MDLLEIRACSWLLGNVGSLKKVIRKVKKGAAISLINFTNRNIAYLTLIAHEIAEMHLINLKCI